MGDTSRQDVSIVLFFRGIFCQWSEQIKAEILCWGYRTLQRARPNTRSSNESPKLVNTGFVNVSVSQWWSRVKNVCPPSIERCRWMLKPNGMYLMCVWVKGGTEGVDNNNQAVTSCYNIWQVPDFKVWVHMAGYKVVTLAIQRRYNLSSFSSSNPQKKTY